MINAPTPQRPSRLRTKHGFAKAGAALALVFGLAACGTVIDPTPPGELNLTGISPATGSAATTVTVTGENIMGIAEVTVGGEPATNVVVRDALGVVVPGENRNGVQITFNPPVLTDGETYDVTVTQGDDESDTLPGAFTYDDDATDPDPDPTGAIRINSGGPAVMAGGVQWLADQHFFTAGAVYTNPNVDAIDGTDADDIYLTERNTGSENVGAQITYVVPVDNGTYDVILHFAEIYYGHTDAQPNAEAGQRVFDIEVEGETVTDYDIYVAAGASATATTLEFTVEVTDETLNITITNGTPVADRGKISGFEIIPVDGGDNGENGENGENGGEG
jgi:hypothetical protein